MLDPQQVPAFDVTDAAAITPGGGRLGSLLGGALDSRLDAPTGCGSPGARR
ncbi:MAG: hypothetical protein L7U56_09090 [Acidimicrobiales bacterium]|nr:hypothetical protein [Acidimicrobiales bacterium]